MKPGAGFFTLAQQIPDVPLSLGSSPEEKEKFWISQVKAAHARYARNSAASSELKS
jgi:hypothetical protein